MVGGRGNFWQPDGIGEDEWAPGLSEIFVRTAWHLYRRGIFTGGGQRAPPVKIVFTGGPLGAPPVKTVFTGGWCLMPPV